MLLDVGVCGEARRIEVLLNDGYMGDISSEEICAGIGGTGGIYCASSGASFKSAVESDFRTAGEVGEFCL